MPTPCCGVSASGLRVSAECERAARVSAYAALVGMQRRSTESVSRTGLVTTSKRAPHKQKRPPAGAIGRNSSLFEFVQCNLFYR
jgi:hypothetical protein